MKFRYASIPYLVWSAVFVLVPLGLVAVFAFTTQTGTFTIDNIARVSSYTPVFMRSVWLAILATAICLCIGYPLAYLMSRMSGVSLGSLKRFEASGQVSLLSLTKLAMALGLADEVRELFSQVPYKDIEEVIRENR